MWRFGVSVLVLAALTACGIVPPKPAWPDQVLELTEVPFFPQTQFQCGPAALATVLNASDFPSRPEALVEQVYVPDRQGSLQAEMLAAVRRAGRLPLTLAPEFSALVESVRAGYPVLVLQNLGVSWWPQWHYAVVVGIDPRRQQLVLRSGTKQRKLQRIRSFMNTWTRSGRWAVVVAQTSRVPDGIGMESWLRAAQALAETGHLNSATAALETAARRWTDRALPGLLLGNLHYRQGDVRAAADAFYRAWHREADSVAAANNLASALIDLNCLDQASSVLAGLATESAPEALAATLALTRDDLEQARRAPTGACGWAEPAL